MSFSSVIDLCVTFVQYFAGIIEGRNDFTIPDSWSEARQVTEVFSIGFDLISTAIPSLEDFRLYFAAIGVVTPLFFIFLGLAFLNPLRVLLWYIVTLAAILVTIVGGLGQILFKNVSFLKDVQISDTVLLIFVIAGPVLLCICGYMYYKRDFFLSFGLEVVSTAVTVEKRMEEETEDIAIATLLIRFILTGALIFFGLVFIGVIGNTPFDVSKGGFASFALGFGYMFISVGGLLGIYMIVGLFQYGRQLQWKAGAFFEEHFLRLFLILFSILYIPIVSPIFLVFNCNSFSCPDGFRLKDEGSIAPFNVTTNEGLCQQCLVYPNQVCPTDFANSICSPKVEDRLESDLTLECNKIKALFWPAAGCMILCTVIGVPLIFYDLISKSVAIIEKEFPIKDIGLEEMRKKEEEEKKNRIAEQEGVNVTTPNNDNAGISTSSPNENKYASATPDAGAQHVENSSALVIGVPPTVENLLDKENNNNKDGDGDGEKQKEGEGDDKVTEFDPNDPHHKWRLQVIASRNVAKFLYQPFVPTTRYTRLFFLIQKLLSVFLSSFIIRIDPINPTAIQLGSSIGIHFIGLVAVSIVLPFLYTFENAIAITMEVILVGTSVLSVLVFAKIDMPNWVYIFILICNGVLPVCALVLALILEWTSEASAEEEQEREKQEELKKEIEEKKNAQLEKKQKKREEALAKKIIALEEEEEGIRNAVGKEEDGAHSVFISTMAIAEAEIAIAAEKTADEEKIKKREALRLQKERLVELEKKRKEEAEQEAKRLEEEAEKKRIQAELEAAEAAAEAEAEAEEEDDDKRSHKSKSAKSGEGDDGDGGDDSDDDDDGSDYEMDLDELNELLEETEKAGDKEKADQIRAELKALDGDIKDLDDLAEKQEQEQLENQSSMNYYRAKGKSHPGITSASSLDDDAKTNKSNKSLLSTDADNKSSMSPNDNVKRSSNAMARQKSITFVDGDDNHQEQQNNDVPVEVIASSTSVANDDNDEEMSLIKKNSTGDFSPAEGVRPSASAAHEDPFSSPPPVLPHAMNDDHQQQSTISPTSSDSIASPNAQKPIPQQQQETQISSGNYTGTFSAGSFVSDQSGSGAAAAAGGRRRSSVTRADLMKMQKQQRLRRNMAKFKSLAMMIGKRAVGKRVPHQTAINNNNNNSTQQMVGGGSSMKIKDPLLLKKKNANGINNNNNNNNNDNDLNDNDGQTAGEGDEASGLFADESDALFLEEEETGVDYEKDLPENFDDLPLEQQLSLRREVARKKRQKKLRYEKKIKLLEEMLQKKRKAAEERLVICQENVDFKINFLVKTRLNMALMIMGFISLAALALCAIALLADTTSLVSSSFGSSENTVRSVEAEYVGYGNWASFTADCCCTAGISVNASSNNIVEKWVCSNGQIREHLRATRPFVGINDTVVDGFVIRDLCAVGFSNGCTVGTTVNSGGTSVVQASCPASVDVTEYQLDKLW